MVAWVRCWQCELCDGARGMVSREAHAMREALPLLISAGMKVAGKEGNSSERSEMQVV